MDVKNLGRTASPPTCACRTWIRHWENQTGEKRPTQCKARGCTRPIDGGAHVINCSDTSKNTWKIVPLCTVHNSPDNRDCFTLGKTKTSSVYETKKCKR